MVSVARLFLCHTRISQTKRDMVTRGLATVEAGWDMSPSSCGRGGGQKLDKSNTDTDRPLF